MTEAPVLNNTDPEADPTEWRRPTLTKLSLDTTQFGVGSDLDGIDGNFVAPPP